MAGLGVVDFIEGVFFLTKGPVYDESKAPTRRALIQFDLPSIVRERYLATNAKRDSLYLIKAGKTRQASKAKIKSLEKHISETMKYYGPAYAVKEYDVKQLTEKPQRKLGLVRELVFTQFLTGNSKSILFDKHKIYLWGPQDIPSARDPLAFQQAVEKAELLTLYGSGLKSKIERFTK
jgi:hypothetical protein